MRSHPRPTILAQLRLIAGESLRFLGAALPRLSRSRRARRPQQLVFPGFE